MISRGITAYKRQLESNPLRTKMMTSAALFSLGDTITQRVEHQMKKCKTKTIVDAAEDKPAARNNSLSQHRFQWDKDRTMR